jgi:hypothetical protein
MTHQQFSELTLEITKKLSKLEKKNFGVFITPKSIITKLHNSVSEYTSTNNLSIKKILEPSCGTCEIVKFCDVAYSGVEIDAIEFNDTVYNSIKDLTFNNKVSIWKENFIKYTTDKLYDLIIGNPPYFVCKKEDVPKKYEEFVHGRPNIFGIFILHSISMLAENGILALVIPKSFLNSLYYSKIRNYIKKTCVIVKMDNYEDIPNFIDTDQSTVGLILQKKTDESHSECHYSMLLNDNYIFTNDTVELTKLFKDSTTLEKMGLKVRTGQIVWNEHKDILTDAVDDTILVYNTNISKDNKFEIKQFKNGEKKQYINAEGKMDPVLLVNRGNGNSSYKLNYTIMKTGPFLVENHLNEIYSPIKLKREQLLDIYEKIITSFNNPKTKKFIETFLGNNSLSKTELETIFPIYDI